MSNSLTKGWERLEVTYPTPWALSYEDENGHAVLGAFARMESRDEAAAALRAEGRVVRTWLGRPCYSGG